MPQVFLQVDDLHKHFPVKRGSLLNRKTVVLKAVDGVSLELAEGQTLSLVGESGCGKTTTARMILRIEEPTRGQVLWQGKEILTLTERETREYRKAVQAVFQDPYSSMNPRMRVGDFVTEALLLDPSLSRRERQERAAEALLQVGLRQEDARLFPHEFSGGQRQRVAIARALASAPQLIVLDEPVSSLDVSIRAQIMNLLRDLQERSGYSFLLIAHHLGTVRYMSDTVAVMYLGRIVELAASEELFQTPHHPYTQALLAAALPDHPDVQRDDLMLKGDVPSPIDIPRGCRLHPRCPLAKPICAEAEPQWQQVTPGHWTACHLY